MVVVVVVVVVAVVEQSSTQQNIVVLPVVVVGLVVNTINMMPSNFIVTVVVGVHQVFDLVSCRLNRLGYVHPNKTCFKRTIFVPDFCSFSKQWINSSVSSYIGELKLLCMFAYLTHSLEVYRKQVSRLKSLLNVQIKSKLLSLLNSNLELTSASEHIIHRMGTGKLILVMITTLSFS